MLLFGIHFSYFFVQIYMLPSIILWPLANSGNVLNFNRKTFIFRWCFISEENIMQKISCILSQLQIKMVIDLLKAKAYTGRKWGTMVVGKLLWWGVCITPITDMFVTIVFKEIMYILTYIINYIFNICTLIYKWMTGVDRWGSESLFYGL